MRFRCSYCGRFMKKEMKSPTYTGPTNLPKVVGWTVSGRCPTCNKYSTTYMRVNK